MRLWHIYDNVFVETEAVKLKTIAIRQYCVVLIHDFLNALRFEYFEKRFITHSEINTYSSVY